MSISKLIVKEDIINWVKDYGEKVWLPQHIIWSSPKSRSVKLSISSSNTSYHQNWVKLNGNYDFSMQAMVILKLHSISVLYDAQFRMRGTHWYNFFKISKSIKQIETLERHYKLDGSLW